MTENIVIELIKNDPWRMEILRAAQSLNLPDWLIGAGFVRNLVWDYLHGFEEVTISTDVDLVYFDPANISEELEKNYNTELNKIINADWSVKNEARMGFKNNQNRNYVSTEDAIAHWPETATSIGVKLLDNSTLKLIAPHGIDDLISLKLRMTPNFGDGYDVFLTRITKKEWLKKWPKLRVIADKKQHSDP